MFKSGLKLKDIITISFLIVILSLIGVGVYQEYQKKAEISLISDSLKFKVPVEDVIQYTEYDANGRQLAEPAPENDNTNGIIEYVYRTNVKVVPDTYKGLNEDVSKRTNNAKIYLKEKKVIDGNKTSEVYIGKFYSSMQFYRYNNEWYETGIARTTKQALLKQIKPTLLTQIKKIFGQTAVALTYYTGSGDGDITQNGGSWNLAHDPSIGTVGSTTPNISAGSDLDTRYDVARGFLPFNTSAIPSGYVVASAVLSVYVYSTGTATVLDNDANAFVSVVQTSQASSTTLIADDFDQCGATTTVAVVGSNNLNLATDIIVGAFNNFTLDTTGISWIKKNGEASNCGVLTGYTCLGIREGHDINRSAINIDPAYNFIYFYSSRDPGTSRDPYLEVTFVTIASIKIDSGTIKVNGGTVKVNSN